MTNQEIKVGWSSKRTDYRGRPYWCYQEQLHTMVRENVLLRHRRFEVFHWSQFDSKHQTLAAAKKRVLELLET
jgi:hypothetical protein